MQEDQAFTVEINRAYHTLQDIQKLPKMLQEEFDYIKDITFLSIDETDDNRLEAFYGDQLSDHMVIKPWYENDEIRGYLKFIYQTPQLNTDNIIWISGLSLFLLELCIICVLVYLRMQLVQPFQRLSSLPEQLAKGHYKGEIQAEKTKYLGNYLWGMSQLQDTLDISKKRQLMLEKEKKEMLLSISHDIKTPLNLIQLYARAIEDNIYQSDDEKLYAAHQINEKSKEIEGYVNTIMKTSRDDILDIQMNIQDFYLESLIEKVRFNFQEACDIRLIDFKVGEYENKLIRGDLDRLQEVLENLFDNACKYGDGLHIEISFYEEDFCQLIRIFNSGTALNPTDCNHIFESFYRGANSTGKVGSGMGLYICRSIMRKMDGEIFMQNETGGVAFILVLR